MDTIKYILSDNIQLLLSIIIFSALGGFIGATLGKKCTPTKGTSTLESDSKTSTSELPTKSLTVLEKEAGLANNQPNNKPIHVGNLTIQDKSLSEVLSAFPEAAFIYKHRKKILKTIINNSSENGPARNNLSVADTIKARRLTDVSFKYYKQLLGTNNPPKKIDLFRAITSIMGEVK